ncbi:ArsR/SmtB family transcription factor [Oceanobacillus damuensis]|uniref:ArsR/SmtB family transcription factor n=1 Tax=Oceanobacillus damuensis TaxID=937928 RepID=UPI00083744F7|nr:metalloregulator ArsR/SmtB family transcription factor [Oceanobacillus damuensis]
MVSPNNRSLMDIFRENTALLQALGDPIRQNIIIILGERGKLNVSEITALADISRPAVSHHLKILKDAEVIKMERQGKNNIYYLDARKKLQSLKGLIEEVERQMNMA